MNRRPAPLKLVLLATVVMAAGLVGWFEQRAGMLRASHREQLLALQQQWAREGYARQATAGEARLRRQRELEQALGGPTEAPARNPDLNLQQMLERLARACAPRGSSVLARVDRFTDFEVLVTLKADPGSNQLAQITLCL